MRKLCLLLAFAAFITVVIITVAVHLLDENEKTEIKELPAVASFQLPLSPEWQVEYYECVLPAPGDHIAFAEISCKARTPSSVFTWRKPTAQDINRIQESIGEMNALLSDWGNEAIPSAYDSLDWSNCSLLLEEPDDKILRFCYLIYNQSNETIFMLARD